MISRITHQLDVEARRGFPRLRGTRISGTVPVTQAVLADVAASFPVVPDIQVLDGNQLVASVWGMSVRATIVEITPALTLVLELPWLARKMASLAPRTRLVGSQVHVDLGAFEAIAEYRYIWKYLSAISVQTNRGRLMVRFELTVE